MNFMTKQCSKDTNFLYEQPYPVTHDEFEKLISVINFETIITRWKKYISYNQIQYCVQIIVYNFNHKER